MGVVLKSSQEVEACITFHTRGEAERTEMPKVEDSYSKNPLYFLGKSKEKISS